MNHKYEKGDYVTTLPKGLTLIVHSAIKLFDGSNAYILGDGEMNEFKDAFLESQLFKTPPASGISTPAYIPVKDKPYYVTEPPKFEPVSLAEVKEHLRVTDTGDDTLITNLIIAAREHCENWLGRKLMQQTVNQWLDKWPELHVDLAIGPASTLNCVRTHDEWGYTTSHKLDDFYLQPGLRPRLFRNAASWPKVLRSEDGIELSYEAGFGTATDVPPAIRHGILSMVGHLYINRADSPSKSAGLSGAESLWRPYRSITI